MPTLTPEGLNILSDVARRHGVSLDTASALLDALARGGGSQAQFNLFELGGMGQWSQGGMVMVGDMFNNGLKHRVDMLCNELSGLLRDQPSPSGGAWSSQSQSQNGGGVSLFVAGGASGSQWWPSELGAPASTGAQNELRYAFFPGTRRLAIQHGGALQVYDTGDNNIWGFSQQQGGDQSLTFNSQYGLVRVADLPLVSPRDEGPPSSPQPPASSFAPEPSAPSFAPPPALEPSAAAASPWQAAPTLPTAALASDDILKTIERLAELRQKGVLTEQEFAAKKADLLARL